jgi:small subunit ribosomal protein S17
MAKSITGLVTSTKGDKTIVISEHIRKTHPLYKKQYTVTSKFMAHDEKNECNVGDKVVIEECRPMSARKKYRLREILSKATLSEKDKAVIEGEETAKKSDNKDETVEAKEKAK